MFTSSVSLFRAAEVLSVLRFIRLNSFHCLCSMPFVRVVFLSPTNLHLWYFACGLNHYEGNIKRLSYLHGECRMIRFCAYWFDNNRKRANTSGDIHTSLVLCTCITFYTRMQLLNSFVLETFITVNIETC